MDLETTSPHFNLWPCFCLALGSWTSTWSPFLTCSWAIRKISIATGLPKRWNKLCFFAMYLPVVSNQKAIWGVEKETFEISIFPLFAKNILNLSSLWVLDIFFIPDFSFIDESLAKLCLTVNTNEHPHSSCVWTQVNDSSGTLLEGCGTCEPCLGRGWVTVTGIEIL